MIIQGWSSRRLAKTSRSFLEGTLQALGWKYAEAGKKALDYQPMFDALGVTLDVSSAHKGKVTVSNKKGRVKDLLREVDSILTEGKLTPRQASALHGKLNYAQGQLFGCILKPGMALLSEWSNKPCKDPETLASAMVFLSAALAQSPPRSISVHDTRPPVILFTDGAYEPEASPPVLGAGLVFIDPWKGVKLVAEVKVPDAFVAMWSGKGRKQLTTHLELFPILVCHVV